MVHERAAPDPASAAAHPPATPPGASPARHLVGAGVLDVGLASLASFCAGLFATREFDPATLGAYALAYRAFVLAVTIPAQAIFLPAEIAAMRVATDSRPRLVGAALRIGLPVAAASAALAMLWPLAWPGERDAPAIGALTVTMAACALASPVQDYVRRALHVAGASWVAAAVSGVQLVVVLGAIVAALAALPPAARWWVPFGGLALANLVSGAIGLALLRVRAARGAAVTPLDARELAGSGGYLVATGLVAATAAFGASAVLARVAGPAALGYAEAARLVAHPLFVLALGLGAVVGPRSVEAAQQRRAARARRIARRLNGAVVALGLAYLGVAGVAWARSPLVMLVPAAYAVPGLAALTVLAHLVAAIGLPERNELLGARQERFLAAAEGAAGTLRLAVAFLGVHIGAAALPVGMLLQGLVRAVAFRRRARALYAPEGAPSPARRAT